MRNWLGVFRIGLPLLVTAVILSGCVVRPYYHCCYDGYYHGYGYHSEYGHAWGRR